MKYATDRYYPALTVIPPSSPTFFKILYGLKIIYSIPDKFLLLSVFKYFTFLNDNFHFPKKNTFLRIYGLNVLLLNDEELRENNIFINVNSLREK